MMVKGRVIFGAVIVKKTRVFVWSSVCFSFPGYRDLPANHSAVFHPFTSNHDVWLDAMTV